MIKKYLEAGQIVGTHGVRGEMRLNPWCDSPDFLKDIKTLYLNCEGNESVEVQSARPHQNIVLIKLFGVDSIEAAQKLKGRVVYINRDDKPLPEGSNYIEDLIDCKVIDADNGKLSYGQISDVITGIANDVWSVKSANGKETLIPVIKDVVIKTDIENETVYIRPLKGLFSDECVIKEDDE